MNLVAKCGNGGARKGSEEVKDPEKSAILRTMNRWVTSRYMFLQLLNGQ